MTQTYAPTTNELVQVWLHHRHLRIEAQRLEHQSFMAAYPPGSIVHWAKGKHTHSGEVVSNHCFSWHLSLSVRNAKTGKIVQISDYDIIRHQEPSAS